MVTCPTCGEDTELSCTTLEDGRRPTRCLSCDEEWVRDAAPDYEPPREARREPLREQPRDWQVTIAENRFDLQSVTERVLARAQRFVDRDDERPWDVLVRHNFLGVLGEDAVEIYLRSCGLTVESWAEDWLEGGVEMGDLAIRIDDRLLMVEVKTNGISAPQTLVANLHSEFIVWCRASPPEVLDPSEWRIKSPGVRLTHWAEAADDWTAGPDQPIGRLRDGLVNARSRTTVGPTWFQ